MENQHIYEFMSCKCLLKKMKFEQEKDEDVYDFLLLGFEGEKVDEAVYVM